MGSSLSLQIKKILAELLKRNVDFFAWTLEYMLEIDPKVICHNLAIDTKVKPIAQKKKKVGKEKHKTIVEETKKLTHAGFTREIQFTT